MSTDIAVVGPGAIGMTVAASLHEAGRTPLLCGHSPREHLDLDTDEGRITVPGPVLTDPSAIDAPADVVFLAVKATQIEAAANWLAALCGPGTVVCVLENGVEQVAMVGPHAGGATLDDGVPAQIADKFRAMPADMGTSILADRQAGRPLEWDVRNGVISRLGRAHGIATPISDVVVPLLAAASQA